MKRLMVSKKGFLQLTSNYNYFADRWFSGVKTTEEAMAAGVGVCELAETSHKVFSIATLEKMMKDWPVESYIVINSTPIVTGDIPHIEIGYKYNYRKALWFIYTRWAGSTEPGDPYLSNFPDKYFNVYVRPIVRPHFLVRYFNACNAIDNQNSMRQSDLEIYTYWVTQSGYFRSATAVELGMGITNGKHLFCHWISQEIEDKNI